MVVWIWGCPLGVRWWCSLAGSQPLPAGHGGGGLGPICLWIDGKLLSVRLFREGYSVNTTVRSNPGVEMLRYQYGMLRGSQWTRAYVMEFKELIDMLPLEFGKQEEARSSFLEGGYVEVFENQVGWKTLSGCILERHWVSYKI